MSMLARRSAWLACLICLIRLRFAVVSFFRLLWPFCSTVACPIWDSLLRSLAALAPACFKKSPFCKVSATALLICFDTRRPMSDANPPVFLTGMVGRGASGATCAEPGAILLLPSKWGPSLSARPPPVAASSARPPPPAGEGTSSSLSNIVSELRRCFCTALAWAEIGVFGFDLGADGVDRASSIEAERRNARLATTLDAAAMG
mmetsp:Transcript_22167/g.56590  ORF Transcript_22167/g.56590 Transcript_22167/m.56590 type:complete len:204 (-) Transcript_22167:263-874(-)